MIDKVRDLCDKVFADSKVDVGYYVASGLYIFMQLALFTLFGLLFDNIRFSILATVITTLIHNYTYTHHCHVLEHCVFLTQIIFIAFGMLSKVSGVEISLFAAILAMRYIYKNSPIRIVHEEKSKEWHTYKAAKIMLILLFISLLLIRFGMGNVAKDVLWSLVMCAVLLIENNIERV
jgi:signal transduction histidine kinase